ncbi:MULTISPECIES: cysteine-rich small domain-containing protein [unclassified Paludibacterium]|uniref:cysteine-rich small domain-containing protein n=1 Tax=unclassified Paludibacterium TaxID=2618429 RepID=UPI001C05AFB9|nr:cysteine-rich small domain-containing protein [Paludibacterium sp. B53371]BEV73074.1 cysteine-rich small domain-containing protein [Paludibacterium sp. THUN1379]
MSHPVSPHSTTYYMGFTHQQCEYLPCHQGVKQEFNCLFCYCPLVNLQCPGPFRIYHDRQGVGRKDCSDCKLPHNGYARSWQLMQKWLQDPQPWDGLPRDSKS